MSKPKKFPIQGGRGAAAHPLFVPWGVAEKAYSVYSALYGTALSLERLAERGGFSPSEMDDLFPAWRQESSEVEQLQAEVARLKEWQAAILIKDSIKTREINTLTKENRDLYAQLTTLREERDRLQDDAVFLREERDRAWGSECALAGKVATLQHSIRQLAEEMRAEALAEDTEGEHFLNLCATRLLSLTTESSHE